MLSYAVGTLIGALAAWRRGSWLDGLLPVTTSLHAVPYFWAALALLFVFGVTLRWFPVSGAYALSTPARVERPVRVDRDLSRHAARHHDRCGVGRRLDPRDAEHDGDHVGEDYVVIAEAKGLPAGG